MSIFNDAGYFGRQWAAGYDSGPNPDPEPAVEFLAGLAAGGPVLELAIGTGQAGLKLVERYADWDRQPFTAESKSHISVYGPA